MTKAQQLRLNNNPYKYIPAQVDSDIIGDRSNRYAGVITNMGRTRPEPTFWGDVVGIGDTSIQPMLYNKGLAVGPSGDESFEFPTDKRQNAIKNGEYPTLEESLGTSKELSNMLSKIEDPRKRSAMLQAINLSHKTKRNYDRLDYTKGSPGATGYYEYSNEVGDPGNISIALGKPGNEFTVDTVGNSMSHEEGHMMSNLYKDSYLYNKPNSYTRGDDRLFTYGVKGRKDNDTYDNLGYELVAQLGGNRNLYTEDMINEVHPYIGFDGSTFNVAPAKEMLRRMEASKINSLYSKEQTAGYMKLLDAEVLRLNKKGKTDAEWLKPYKEASFEDGDPYRWRGTAELKRLEKQVKKTRANKKKVKN